MGVQQHTDIPQLVNIMNVMVSVIFCIIKTNRYFVILIFCCTTVYNPHTKSNTACNIQAFSVGQYTDIVKFFFTLGGIHIDHQRDKSGNLQMVKMNFNFKVYFKSCVNTRTPCKCSKDVIRWKSCNFSLCRRISFNVFLLGVQ